MKFNRIITVVLDSVGIGEAPDANHFDDVGADTLGHIGQYWGDKFKIPTLTKLGLGNIRRDDPMIGIEPVAKPLAYFGKMQEVSAGKDSMDGHWEMMGEPVTRELNIFPNGFSDKIIHKIEQFSNRKVLLNRPCSGTQAIHDYGEQQLKTGALIVYTSGDSVLQIAAHEEVIPLEELYRICRFVRNVFDTSDYQVGRVIARPYVGTSPDNFERTSNRKDFTMTPQSDTALDLLKAAGVEVVGIGKINDIFSGRGITSGVHTISNEDGMDQVIKQVSEPFPGFVFANLVDFDAKFGHRRDPKGYGEALMRTDVQLGQLLQIMKSDDLLVLTADHGNDPTFKGTDHTREFVPLLAYSPQFDGGESLGIRHTFGDLGQSVLDNFGVENELVGESFLRNLK